VEVYEQVAEAVAGLHEHGLVHRDLKPANVLVLDEPLRAYIANLGFAVAVDEPDALTGADAIVGTPLYVPPEEITDGTPRFASDVYSLGVMLYEALVTGGLWWPDATIREILEGRLDEIPEARFTSMAD